MYGRGCGLVKLPFSQSADRNKEAIGDALDMLLASASNVFEFGSGTGQHAVYLCQRFPHLRWQPSELKPNIETIGLQIQQARLSNILVPVECDVMEPMLFNDADASTTPDAVSNGSGNTSQPGASHFGAGLRRIEYLHYSFAYSANTAHIMSIEAVERMIAIAAVLLQPAGYFALYGPFRYGSEHTAEGNIQFDSMLREQDPAMGVRDKFELDRMAVESGMTPADDLEMPSNNRILLWQKVSQN